MRKFPLAGAPSLTKRRGAAAAVATAVFVSLAFAASPASADLVDGCVVENNRPGMAIQYSISQSGCAEYAQAPMSCQKANLASCVPVAKGRVTTTLNSIKVDLSVGALRPASATSFLAASGESSFAPEYPESFVGADGASCHDEWAAKATNHISWGKSNFRTTGTSMARTAGCRGYRATTHATVGIVLRDGRDEFVDVKWPNSRIDCHQQDRQNSTASSCTSGWFYTKGGETWIGTMGGTFYHGYTNQVWRMGGEIDLRHTDDSR